MDNINLKNQEKIEYLDNSNEIISVLEHVKKFSGGHAHGLNGELVDLLIIEGLISGDDESEREYGQHIHYRFNNLRLTIKGSEYLHNHFAKPIEIKSRRAEQLVINIFSGLVIGIVGFVLGKIF